MKTNKQLLQVAINQLGNTGGKYRKYVGVGGSWCDMYVFWLFDANGCGSLIKWTKNQRYYCPASIQWCRKNLAQIPPYLAMACDIMYFDWDKNGVPNHIGIVESKVSTSRINTIEGNTSGGKVARKTRDVSYDCGIFRPHFVPTGLKKSKLKEDGDCGYKTIFMLQVALGLKPTGVLDKATVMALQKRAGCKQDGAWGKATSRAVQKLVGLTGKAIDSQFGKQSVTAMQKCINKVCGYTASKPATSKPTSKPATKPTTTKPVNHESTKPSTKPTATKTTYRIDVDLTNQICTVYKNGKAVMSEFVSTARKGKTTPTGNFKIQGASGGRKAKLRTAKMSGGKSYAEYLCRFKGAKCMHGVPYSKRNTKGLVSKTEFNKLGTPASAGCVRMPIKLARYIYNNCPVGTPVKVFRGTKGVYPMGKPKKYTATSNVDPTR